MKTGKLKLNHDGLNVYGCKGKRKAKNVALLSQDNGIGSTMYGVSGTTFAMQFRYIEK